MERSPGNWSQLNSAANAFVDVSLLSGHAYNKSMGERKMYIYFCAPSFLSSRGLDIDCMGVWELNVVMVFMLCPDSLYPSELSGAPISFACPCDLFNEISIPMSSSNKYQRLEFAKQHLHLDWNRCFGQMT